MYYFGSYLLCLRVMCVLNTSCLRGLKPSELRHKVLFVRLWVQSHQRNTDKLVDDTGTQCQPWLTHNETLTPRWHYYRYSKARMCVYVCLFRERESERERAQSWHINLSQSRRCFQCRLWGLVGYWGKFRALSVYNGQEFQSRLYDLFTCLK